MTPLHTQTGHWSHSQTSSGYQRPLLPLENKFYQEGSDQKTHVLFLCRNTKQGEQDWCMEQCDIITGFINSLVSINIIINVN